MILLLTKCYQYPDHFNLALGLGLVIYMIYKYIYFYIYALVRWNAAHGLNGVAQRLAIKADPAVLNTVSITGNIGIRSGIRLRITILYES